MNPDLSISILLVDDNRENLYSLRNLLKADNYDFILASSGEDALKAALKNDPALILLDVQMPDMDGFEVAGILKSNRKTENIPIIFITAIDNNIDYAIRGFDVGALDYIFKPINPILLKAKVRNLVSLYKTQWELMQLNDELEEKVLMRTSELQARNQELNKMNEILDNFLHVSAHDFRSPLSNINLISKLLRTAKTATEKDLLLSSLDSSVNRMEQTIRGIIEMVEVQENKNNPVELIRFDEILRFVLQEFEKLQSEVQAEIITDFAEASSIDFIPVYLESIFRNLVSNSFKYKSPHCRLRIEINSKTEGDFIVLAFKDNGIGMDISKNGKDLFKPFFRVNREIEGKGIGLHIVKNIVEMNGGNIFVSSVIGKGTTFFVYLKPYTIPNIEKTAEHIMA